MATSMQHNAARNDYDLVERFTAIAEKNGIPNAQAWVEDNRGRLVSAPVDGTTVADVHAYAVGSYVPTPKPGQDETKVTDVLLDQAVDVVWAAQAPQA